jgi:hypothetical protein
VTIAIRPFWWDETAMDMPVIWVRAKRKYFWLWDSTAQITPNLARRARGFLLVGWVERSDTHQINLPA